jgi:putative tryptophan/tyrosine transport system substrate-binding protein
VAANGPHATGDDAGDRLYERRVAGVRRFPDTWLSTRPQGNWLCGSPDVAIKYQWAEGQYDRLPALAAELVASQVAVIVAAAGTPSALAAKAATRAIPIVFGVGADPIQLGLVKNLSRPTGNLTGGAALSTELAAKSLDLLHELLPTADTIALLVNPTNPFTEPATKEVQIAARSLGLQLHVLGASNVSDIDAAFGTLIKLHANALIVPPDPFLLSHRAQIVELTGRQRVPAIYGFRDFVAAGGLMSYNTSLADLYRQVGVYAGKILKGTRWPTCRSSRW